MIDFNLWEIAGLVILAILVFGPEKLPEMARKAARILQYLRTIGNDARGQLRRELGPEFDNISLADLNPKTFVAKHLFTGEEVADLRQIRDEVKAGGNLLHDTVTDARAAVAEQPLPPAATASDEVKHPVSGRVPFDPEAT